jgi:hypothetical protein
MIAANHAIIAVFDVFEVITTIVVIGAVTKLLPLLAQWFKYRRVLCSRITLFITISPLGVEFK